MNERPSGLVIVAYDGSQASRAAASYAAREACRRRVKLTMIHAHQPTPMWRPAALILDDYSWERDWIHRILTHGRNEVTSAFPQLKIDTKIMSGSAPARSSRPPRPPASSSPAHSPRAASSAT